MTTALIELEAAGYDARELREHSLGWIAQALKAVDRRRRHEYVHLLSFEVLAAALGAGSPEAAAEIDSMMERLTPPEDGEDGGHVDHLLDPNAQTDWETLRASGRVTRVKVAVPEVSTVPTEEPDGRRGTEG